MSRSTRGPWFWILGGCGCLALVAALVVTLLVWSGARMVKRVVEQLDDPTLRRAAAERVLGGDALLSEYDAAIALEIPLVGDFVVLHRAQEGQTRADRTFIVARARMLERDAGEQFEELLRQQGFGVERAGRLADGRLEFAPFEASWSGFRGRIDDGHAADRPVVLSLISIECRQADRLGRVALWFESFAADADSFEGSVVDPVEIEALLRRIDPCPASLWPPLGTDQSEP